MRPRVRIRRRRGEGRRASVAATACLGIAVLATLWAILLFHAPADSGSLDTRVTAVGATVRCPICPEPLSLNTVQNPQAIQMRQFIRDALLQGQTEDQVRHALVARYGIGILLAPPQTGFDLLIWLVPLGAVSACAVAVQFAAQRWVRNRVPVHGSTPAAALGAPAGPEMRRYEALLDRELARRE